MKYYRVTLNNGDELFHESKVSLSNKEILAAMQDEATLSPADLDEINDIDQITEEEYEEGVI